MENMANILPAKHTCARVDMLSAAFSSKHSLTEMLTWLQTCVCACVCVCFVHWQNWKCHGLLNCMLSGTIDQTCTQAASLTEPHIFPNWCISLTSTHPSLNYVMVASLGRRGEERRGCIKHVRQIKVVDKGFEVYSVHHTCVCGCVLYVCHIDDTTHKYSWFPLLVLMGCWYFLPQLRQDYVQNEWCRMFKCKYSVICDFIIKPSPYSVSTSSTHLPSLDYTCSSWAESWFVKANSPCTDSMKTDW